MSIYISLNAGNLAYVDISIGVPYILEPLNRPQEIYYPDFIVQVGSKKREEYIQFSFFPENKTSIHLCGNFPIGLRDTLDQIISSKENLNYTHKMFAQMQQILSLTKEPITWHKEIYNNKRSEMFEMIYDLIHFYKEN